MVGRIFHTRILISILFSLCICFAANIEDSMALLINPDYSLSALNDSLQLVCHEIPTLANRQKKMICKSVALHASMISIPFHEREKQDALTELFECSYRICGLSSPKALNTLFMLRSGSKRENDAMALLSMHENKMKMDPKGLCSAYRYMRIMVGVPKSIPFLSDFNRMFSYCKPLLTTCKHVSCTSCQDYFCDSMVDFFDAYDNGVVSASDYGRALESVLPICQHSSFLSSIHARVSGHYSLALSMAQQIINQMEIGDESECMASKLIGRVYVKMISSAASLSEAVSVAKKCCNSIAFKHMIAHGLHPTLIKDLAVCVSQIAVKEPEYLRTMVQVNWQRTREKANRKYLGSLWQNALHGLGGEMGMQANTSKTILEAAIGDCNSHSKESWYFDTEKSIDAKFSGMEPFDGGYSMSVLDLTRAERKSVQSFIENPENQQNTFFPIIIFALFTAWTPLPEEPLKSYAPRMCQEAYNLLIQFLKTQRQLGLSFYHYYTDEGRRQWASFPAMKQIGCCKIFIIFHNFMMNMVALADGDDFKDPTLFHEWRAHGPNSYQEFGRYLETFLGLIKAERDNTFSVADLVSGYESVRPFFNAESSWRIAELIDPMEDPEKALGEGYRAFILYLAGGSFRLPAVTYARILNDLSHHPEPRIRTRVLEGLEYVIDGVILSESEGKAKWSYDMKLDMLYFVMQALTRLSEPEKVLHLFQDALDDSSMVWSEPSLLAFYFNACENLGLFNQTMFMNITRPMLAQRRLNCNFKAKLLVYFVEVIGLHGFDLACVQDLSSEVDSSVRLKRLISMHAVARNVSHLFPRPAVQSRSSDLCEPAFESNNFFIPCDPCRKVRRASNAKKKEKQRLVIDQKEINDHINDDDDDDDEFDNDNDWKITVQSRLFEQMLEEWDVEKLDSFRHAISSFSLKDVVKVKGLVGHNNLAVFRIRWHFKGESNRIMLSFGVEGNLLILKVFPRRDGYPKRFSAENLYLPLHLVVTSQ